MDSVLQYNEDETVDPELLSRNPCFSGQCFAILQCLEVMGRVRKVAILVLVDSVLQYAVI